MDLDLDLDGSMFDEAFAALQQPVPSDVVRSTFEQMPSDNLDDTVVLPAGVIGIGFDDVPSADVEQDFAAPPPRTIGGGRWQRTVVGMLFLRTRKKLKQEQRRRQRQGQHLDSLTRVWNSRIALRIGDSVMSGSSRDGGGGVHPNSWTLRGMVRVAFKSLGSKVGGHDGDDEVDVTTANAGLLRATSTCAAIFSLAQSQRVGALVQKMKDRTATSIFLSSHYDATPRLVRFGLLQQAVQQHARYLRLSADGKWELQNAEQFCMEHARAAPRSGVVEVFAQRMAVSCFLTDSATWHRQDILCAPRILQNSGASVVCRAVNLGVPQCSVDGLTDICEGADFLDRIDVFASFCRKTLHMISHASVPICCFHKSYIFLFFSKAPAS